MTALARNARGLTALMSLQRDAALNLGAVGGALALAAWLLSLYLV